MKLIFFALKLPLVIMSTMILDSLAKFVENIRSREERSFWTTISSGGYLFEAAAVSKISRHLFQLFEEIGARTMKHLHWAYTTQGAHKCEKYPFASSRFFRSFLGVQVTVSFHQV